VPSTLPSTTLSEFYLPPDERPLLAVFAKGALLIHRGMSEGAIKRYQLPGGFFVGVYYNTPTGQVQLLQLFHKYHLPRKLHGEHRVTGGFIESLDWRGRGFFAAC
jgi:hypothetical protein